MDLSVLKAQVNSIMDKETAENKTVSKITRDILYYESELLQNNILIQFSKTIAELSPEHAALPFGSGQFERKDYLLSWRKSPKGVYRFVLINLPYKNAKILTDCPLDFQKQTLKVIPSFIEELATRAKEIYSDHESSYDNDYANEN